MSNDRNPKETPMKESIVQEQTVNVKSWALVLISYFVLLSVTSYIAFFQSEYNPAGLLSEEDVALLENEATKDLVKDALEKDSSAYAKRRELASQSFNVVLGAILGFLSASAANRIGRTKK
jgi:hypothetical protein